MIPNPAGGYGFLAGIDPYSSGVAALRGYEIVHCTLETALPWRDAFGAIGEYLADRALPINSLCGLELRCPAPRSFDGFAEFNTSYHDVLLEFDLLVDGLNPLARTNVAPVFAPPGAVVAHAFSFTRPVEATVRRTFVGAGAGELVEDELHHTAVVRPGDTTPGAMTEKARHVLATMSKRLAGLGASWRDVTTVDIYTALNPGEIVRAAVIPEIGAAASRGLHWYPAAPPVDSLAFEMDVRGVATELVVDLR